MDLISRAWLKEAIHNFFNGLTHEVTEEDIQRYIEVAPSAFEGMTNGEVAKAVFGIKDEQIVKGESIAVIRLSKDRDLFMSIDLEVWDSPYKGVSE